MLGCRPRQIPRLLRCGNCCGANNKRPARILAYMTGLSELGWLLHEEHFRILVWVSDLQSRIAGEAGEQRPDLNDDEEKQRLEKLIHSLDHFMVHHAFEEDVLFPTIRSRGEGDLTVLASEEHVKIEPLIERLRMLAIEILGHGALGRRWAEFRAVAEALSSEMISHLEQEEVTIHQQLRDFLDVDTDRRLALRHVAARLRTRQAGPYSVQ
jgi:hemerythrin-like domain-containing protein